MAVIELNELSKWYGEVLGVSNLTASIEPGVTGLLGPNGSGKSTLLNLMAGLLRPNRGRVAIDGQPVWSNPGMYRILGYCPDSVPLYERMTGRQFLAFIGRLNGLSKNQAVQAAGDMLERMGLSDAADKRVGAYSRGMRQRVMLGHAMMHDPQVLLLDEPLSGLDPPNRYAISSLIRQFGDQGKTILVSSHILHEVEEMTHRILVLNNGMLLAEGDVYEIRELIEEQPRRVRLFTPQRQRLSSQLITCDEVQTLQFGHDPEEIIVQTSSPELFFNHIHSFVLDDNIAIHHVEPLDENLQSVFEYLVNPL